MNGSAVAASDCRYIVEAPCLEEILRAEDELKDPDCSAVELVLSVKLTNGRIERIVTPCTGIDLPPNLFEHPEMEVLANIWLGGEVVGCTFRAAEEGSIGAPI